MQSGFGASFHQGGSYFRNRAVSALDNQARREPGFVQAPTRFACDGSGFRGRRGANPVARARQNGSAATPSTSHKQKPRRSGAAGNAKRAYFACFGVTV